MPTKITLWLEKNKPTKVRMTKHEDFYLEDMSAVFADLAKTKTKTKEADNGAGCKPGKGTPKAKLASVGGL